MPSSPRKLRFRLLRVARWGLGVMLAIVLVAGLLSTNWVLIHETDRLHVWAGAGEVVLITSDHPSTFFDSAGFHVQPRSGPPLRLSMPAMRPLRTGMYQIILPLWPIIAGLIVAIALLSWFDPHSLARRTARRASDGRAILRWTGVAFFGLLAFGWLLCQAGHRVSVAVGKTELILCDRLRFGVARHDSTAYCNDASRQPRRFLLAKAYAEDPVWYRRLGMVGIDFSRVFDLRTPVPGIPRFRYSGHVLSTQDFEATLQASIAPMAELIDEINARNDVNTNSPSQYDFPTDPSEFRRVYAEKLRRMAPLTNLADYLNRPLSISPPTGPGSELVKITSTTLLLPYWVPMAVVFIPTAWLWVRRLRGRPGHCEVCGYNLTGLTSDKCPECGTPLPSGISARLNPPNRAAKGD